MAIAQSYCSFYNDKCEPRILSIGKGWTNKMFVKAELMPHNIRITNIRVERLQDISDKECLREGVEDYKSILYPYRYKLGENKWKAFASPREAFASLIDKISGKGTWKSNPYVFVYEFESVD